MKRLTVGLAAALALLSGPAAACEFHEMMAYGYGGPQRYSPFARARVHQAPPEEEVSAPAQGRNASGQASQSQSAQNERDGGDQEREEAPAGQSDRTENVLAARR